jgi:hypothetical protein
MQSSSTSHDEQDGGLPPPGSRWGSGAQSVLPYLTKTLQSRPSETSERPEARDRREARTREDGVSQATPSRA